MKWLLVSFLCKHVAAVTQKSTGQANSRKPSARTFALNRSGEAGWYTVDLKLGSSVSRFIVDTGSPWLWAYGGSEETSAKPASYFSIQYMSASVSGIALQERLDLGAGELVAAEEPEGNRLRGNSQSNQLCKVGRATEGDKFWVRQWDDCGIQGVLGLACGAADAGRPMLQAETPANVALGSALACISSLVGPDGAPGFAVQLTKSGGALTFGGIPTELQAGLVQMPPSLLCGNWRVPLTVSVVGRSGNGKTHGIVSEAVLDSAAVGIVGLAERVADLATSLEAKIEVRDGSMVFVAPCSNAASMPSLTFALGGPGQRANVELSGEDLLFPDPKHNGGCRLILGTWDSPQWLLGMPFFQKIRGAVFDPVARVVSIAP